MTGFSSLPGWFTHFSRYGVSGETDLVPALVLRGIKRTVGRRDGLIRR